MRLASERSTTTSFGMRLLICALASGIFFAGPAHAGTASGPMRVTATVPESCTVHAPSLEFGSYEPIGANATSPKDAETTLNLTCTEGAAAWIGLDGGLYGDRMLSGTLRYEVYRDSARTNVWGSVEASGVAHVGTGLEEAVPAFGRIPEGQNPQPGEYADTVVVTVHF